ncbi:ferric reductase NAD binding domain-containing protein [Mycena sp. CBHHK59/15]|nr:ferric reductase NAD binding domain-containing protein [Mycena sp. CBHHK59/15]
MDSVMDDLSLFASVGSQTMAKAVNPDRAPSHSRSYGYPKQIWYLLASFIALVSLCHFAMKLYSFLRLKNPSIDRAGPRSVRGPIALRRLPVAMSNVVRNIAFRLTIPFGGSYRVNFAEFFIGSAYIAILFTWALLNTTSIAGVHYSPQYYANRAGLIAATQFPLMIALGMKNNVLTFLTGISFDKLNVLHRVAARVLCVMLWIHGAGHIIENGSAGNRENLQEVWFRCGIMALSSLTLLCFLSIRPLRNRAYELFLAAHFCVALVFLCGAYYHAENNGLGYYLWPSLFVWGLDRFLRLVRIFLVNGGHSTLLSTLLRKNGPHPLHASIDVVFPQFLRVAVRRPDHFRWAAGQMAYLSIPSISAAPWETHPFTIASIDDDIRQTDGDNESPSRDESCEKGESVDSLHVAAEALSPTGYSKKLVFLLRVHDGFTKRLLNAALAPETGATFKAYIDGPYCNPPSIRGFGTVLFVCGGSGISFTLPLLLDLIRRANKGTNPECHKVTFVWAVRHAEHIKLISDTLSSALEGISDSLAIDIRIHITACVEDTDGASYSVDPEKSESSLRTSEDKLQQVPCVRVFSGRPNVHAIVKSEVAAATGAMAVNVCGTGGMAEHVRSALRSSSSASDIIRGGPSVTLHVEAFGDS